MNPANKPFMSNFWLLWRSVFFLVCALLGMSILLVQIYGFLGMRSFEFSYIKRLLGLKGLATLTIVDVGIALVFCFVFFTVVLKRRVKLGRICQVALLLWFVVCLWVLQWLFMETPLTVRMKRPFLNREVEEVALGAFAPLVRSEQIIDKKAIMYERIRLNRPEIYSRFDISKTIEKYAEIYHVEPVLLFHWLYLTSFYGEATSGRVPFLRNMTAETFRDFIQVHLPYWFVESAIRKNLIESTLLETICFGSDFGHKLRYAFQKATYDVSLEPYDTNIFSDVFLILKEYKSHFPEIFCVTNLDQLTIRLRDAFLQLEDNCLLQPYECPYNAVARPKKYYTKYREALIMFSRATFYKSLFDFEFATKIQALVARYYETKFKDNLGNAFWAKVPMQQKSTLIAMLRDVYCPNIGRLSYNVYALPEFNCAPFHFVVNEAVREKDRLLDNNEIWRPTDFRKLWGAASFKLRVLSEVWQVMYGRPLATFRASNTIEEALNIVLMNSYQISDER